MAWNPFKKDMTYLNISIDKEETPFTSKNKGKHSIEIGI